MYFQDDVKKDERGKLLQYLISVISGEAVADDFKQVKVASIIIVQGICM